MNPRERLHRYFDAELPDGEKEAFEEHLTAEQKAQLEALGDVRAALRATVDRETQGVDLVSGLDLELRRRSRRQQLVRWSPVMAVAAMAAAALLWLRPPTPTVVPMADAGKHGPALIESLEVEGALATVFDLDDDDGSTATVIWTSDDDDEETL